MIHLKIMIGQFANKGKHIKVKDLLFRTVIVKKISIYYHLLFLNDNEHNFHALCLYLFIFFGHFFDLPYNSNVINYFPYKCIKVKKQKL